MMRAAGLASFILLGVVHLVVTPAGAATSAPPCTPETRAAILAPALDPNDAVALGCSLRLWPGDVVTKRLVLEGGRASGVAIHCAGATIGRADVQPTFPNATIEIRSRRIGPTAWERPADIAIRGCTILGPVRVWGMGLNGQGEAVKVSSRALGHTERAQAAAPTRITIADSTLAASGQIPLYLAPGVTEVMLTGSRVTGRSGSVAVYLDAESARNTLDRNSFAIETGREVVAVDGSADNRITGNRFEIGWRGGIYLYRNCGEGGTIRHQTPSRNVIQDNRFRYGFVLHLPEISVGAREGFRLYCGDDAGYPFGSSIDDGDHATDNVLSGNVVE